MLAMCATPIALYADGGMVVLRHEVPPFVIVVFASPAPVRAGLVDLSVMVQDTETMEPVLDAAVSIEVRGVRYPATHRQAQNKLLYATAVKLVDVGDCAYSVKIDRNGSSTAVSGLISVAPQPELPAYTMYFLLPPIGLVLFALHERLRRALTSSAPQH